MTWLTFHYMEISTRPTAPKQFDMIHATLYENVDYGLSIKLRKGQQITNLIVGGL